MAYAVQIRPGLEKDVPAIVEIYNYYVVNTTVTFDVDAFTADQRRMWFRQFKTTGRHQIVVAESASAVLGYAYSTVFRARAAYDTTVETTVYVDRAAQRGGIGTALYTELFKRLAHEDVHRAVACIGLPNEPSIALHERMGFRAQGSLAEVGRKFGKYWDVGWFEKSLP